MPTISNGNILALHKKLSYGVGHVQNDLAASMLFSYWIIFLNKVVKLDSGLAGIVFLLGQISDAIFTPFIGYKSDRGGCFNIGRRKSWHLFGSICAAVTFPFLFIDSIVSPNAANWVQFIYYAISTTIFHIGYASIQISHLSLIPELTSKGIERVALNSYRYAFAVISNMTVYGLVWALFDFVHPDDESEDLGPGDANTFRILVLIVVGIGIFSSVIFHVGVKESIHSPIEVTNSTVDDAYGSKMKWKDWFKETQFYQVTMVYMCSRLTVIMSQAYLPFFLTETISLDKTSIAIMPFIVYVSGLVTSFLMRYVNKKVGRKITYMIGILFTLGGCVTFYFLKDGSKLIYMAVVLNGVGGSTVLVTSLSMIADLIGSNTESGAFVYGAIGVTDKLSTGVAIALIQQLNPCGSTQCVAYFRNIVTFVPGSASLLASVVLATLIPVDIGFRRIQVIIQPSMPITSMTVKEPSNSSGDTTSNVSKDTQFCTDLCNDWL